MASAEEWCDLAQQRLRTINEQADTIKTLRIDLDLAGKELERSGNVLAGRSIRATLEAT